MQFNEPVFLLLFLPVLLAAYYLLPARWPVLRNLLLGLAGLVFYAWGGKQLVFLMLGAVAVNFVAALAIERRRGTPAGRWWLAGGILLNLAALLWFKYANFIAANLGVTLARVPQPLGISFFTFVAIAYLVEVHRGAAAVRSPLQSLLHLLFFSRVVAGPIVRPRDVDGQLAQRTVTREQFATAIRRFILGLGKKVLIANTVAGVADQIFAIPTGELTASLAWTGVVCYTAQIYFDFAGYSEMAIGLGGMFGFRIPENFNYPYIATSVRDFWRRWHMTLSGWLRDYLYIPLGGSRCAPWRAYFNLVVVFALCGLWHGASWSFIVWGLFQGLFLVLERLGWEAALEKMWAPCRHIYLMLVVMVSWVLFRTETLAQATGYLAAMTGLTHPTGVQDGARVYLTPLVLVALAVAVIGSMPVGPALTVWRERVAGRAEGPVTVGALVVLFVVAVMFIAASTYAPFIYAKF
jgi:alginate O-acetyltransferase complex protein AlgI